MIGNHSQYKCIRINEYFSFNIVISNVAWDIRIYGKEIFPDSFQWFPKRYMKHTFQCFPPCVVFMSIVYTAMYCIFSEEPQTIIEPYHNEIAITAEHKIPILPFIFMMPVILFGKRLLFCFKFIDKKFIV